MKLCKRCARKEEWATATARLTDFAMSLLVVHSASTTVHYCYSYSHSYSTRARSVKEKLINAALKALSRDFDMRSVRINNLTAYCSADCSRVVIKTEKENLFFIESLGKCLYSCIIIFDL